MKKCIVLINCLLCLYVNAQEFKASWISIDKDSLTTPNSWYCYRKTITLSTKPGKVIIAKIATDTKYWLWINDKLIVYEGGLKRGPDPYNTYYDEIDIGNYLTKGKNTIAILVWFWGGKGFSHNNSKSSALYFECNNGTENILSDNSWRAVKYSAYIPSAAPAPNFRLSEPNIAFDAQKEIKNWFTQKFNDSNWPNVITLGKPPIHPWNQLIKRNIPLFKFAELKDYVSKEMHGDTLVCKLPYNGQFSPWIKLDAAVAGKRIFISSDTWYLGTYPGDTLNTICSEYFTKSGKQEYESFGWISGHEIRYVIPENVKVLSVKFRETGYNSNFSGYFICNDSLLNRLWQKAQRTLYVNMRDNYMDCPDRERAQWAGDAAMEMAQAFYALDRNSDALSRKLFLDLANWQRNDSTIYNPIPETNWKLELPVHSLMPLSELWRYFLYTNDTTTMRYVYPSLKKYLAVWTIQTSGQLIYRAGGWDWGDWGTNKDMVLIQHGWYLLATETAAAIANFLHFEDDKKLFEQRIALLKQFLNSSDCWNGEAYRYKDYKDSIDDRANALMLLAGVADSSKYKALANIFLTQKHASPWMEKFVLESLFKMNEPALALEQMKMRYKEMIESPLTTLWEIWEHNEHEVHGNSGYNHGWAGGPLVLLSQYCAGIMPDTAKAGAYIIKPDLATLKFIRAGMPVQNGNLEIDINKTNTAFSFRIVIPSNTPVSVAVPKYGYDLQSLKCNRTGYYLNKNIEYINESEKYYWFKTNVPGSFVFEASFTPNQLN